MCRQTETISKHLRNICSKNHFNNTLQAMVSFNRLDIAHLEIKALTPKELQITKLVLKGQNNHFIAKRLGVKECTVKKHREHILRKLGINSFRQLIALLSDSRSQKIFLMRASEKVFENLSD